MRQITIGWIIGSKRIFEKILMYIIKLSFIKFVLINILVRRIWDVLTISLTVQNPLFIFFKGSNNIDKNYYFIIVLMKIFLLIIKMISCLHILRPILKFILCPTLLLRKVHVLEAWILPLQQERNHFNFIHYNWPLAKEPFIIYFLTLTWPNAVLQSIQSTSN